jgi:hypothetical protein
MGPNSSLLLAEAALWFFVLQRVTERPRQVSGIVRHPNRSEALNSTVAELLPKDTQPPTDTDHQMLPSLSDPNNIRWSMKEALNKYQEGCRHSLSAADHHIPGINL